MLLSRIILVITAFFLCQCAHITNYNGPHHYVRHPMASISIRTIPVYMDANFGNFDKAEIQKGLDQWNYALNGSLVLDVVDYNASVDALAIENVEKVNGLMFLRIDSLNRLIPSYNALAFNYPRVGGNYIYIIRDRMFNDAIKPITMHEVGHALGAVHTDGGLMNPYYYTYMYQCVDRVAANEVAEYQHLSLGRLNWCYFGESEDKALPLPGSRGTFPIDD